MNTSLIWRTLSTFPRAARIRGETIYASPTAVELHPVREGVFEAFVHDNGLERMVTAEVLPDYCGMGCECGAANCPHQYAALLAILSHASLESTRRISEGRRLPKAALELEDKRPLQRWAEVALKRKLTREESSLLIILQRAFEQSKLRGRIPLWDLQSAGWYNLHPQALLVADPRDAVEFWTALYVDLREQGLKIPEFLREITDTTEIDRKLEETRRKAAVDNWKHRFRYSQTLTRPRRSPGVIDLRLVVCEDEAFMEWKGSEDEDFRRIRRNHMNKLGWDHGKPDPRLTPEGQVLRATCMDPHSYRDPATLEYDSSDAVLMLEAALRNPTLESRIVGLNREPLPRLSERLVWEVQDPANASGDYKILLRLPDGAPAPEIFVACPGGLYVTAQGVYEGPRVPDLFNDLAEEVAIPAEALETTEGASFLSAENMPMPPRLQDRVQRERHEITIQCKLSDRGGKESCDFRVTAKARSEQLVWDSAWVAKNPAPGAPSARSEASLTPEPIYVIDRTPLEKVHSLLEELPLRNTTAKLGDIAMRTGKNFAETFAQWLKKVPPYVELKLLGELESFQEGDVSGTVRLEIEETEIDWFDLRVVLNVSDTTLTPEEIKLLLGARGRYVRLTGKGWKRLKYELSEEDNASLAKLGLSASDFSPEAQRLHALQLGHEAAKRFISPQQVQRIDRRVSELKTRVAPQVPSGISAQLREYQVAGFHFLAFLAANRFGGILADDMGLGKTLETLTWLAWLREELQKSSGPESSVPPSLVVCPKSVTDNWHAEAGRFASGLRVCAWGTDSVQAMPDRLHEADIHVINYNQLRLLADRLFPVRWLAVILDEGQYIKNPTSQTAEIARGLRAQHRLVLTGTPIENRLLDLWSLMAFAMPGVLGSRTHFTKLYDSKTDPLARQRLAARVRPFLLRRTKGQVAKDLPDKIEEDLLCEMEGEQLSLYRAELKRAQQMLLALQTQKELAKQQFNVLTSLLRLRQICCDPRLLVEDSKASSAKLEALLEQLEPLMDEGHKVLVFSQFVEMLNLVRTAVNERGWRSFYLAGDTEDRGDLVKHFNTSTESSVFLISLKAGGFGLNLTSASYVVLFDPWWNPAVENQAIDRTHRIGQVNKVIAYRLLVKNSVEEKIRALQKTKRALAEDVLGEERFAQSLSLDDLRFLLAD